MIRAFRRFIDKHKLFFRDEKILLAISGGVDSVVMLDLFYQLEMNCIVAHCNFSLRGDESKADEVFVAGLAKKYQYPFYQKRFDTRKIAHEKKISIEMAARELRYNWFSWLCKHQNCQYIAIAHHSDDVIETLFINLCRGTGIRGLTGIKTKTGKIVRPLLEFSRFQLEQYAHEHGLEYREDSTNTELDHVRNRIRHQVLPVLEGINPGIRRTLMENIRHFREVEQIYRDAIEQKREELVTIEGNSIKISIPGLLALTTPATFLFEFLLPFGFHFRDAQNIALSLKSISGKCFYSATHRLIRDREFLLISPYKKEENKKYEINEWNGSFSKPFPFQLETLERTEAFSIPSGQDTACLDAAKLQLPLQLRQWEQGDSFYPLGMKGSKKLSDFFIDQKFSLEQKENTWLITSGKAIVWVIGQRIDDRFKITPETERICKISLLNG